MKITLNGAINRTYVQSLCMAFFHGIKFPAQEQENKDGLELFVSIEEKDDGLLSVATLKSGERVASKEIFYKPFGETMERSLKTAVGHAVYSVCSAITQKNLEWGILTGIRPSKVAADLLKENSAEEATKILIDKYLLSAEKAALAIAVAKNESCIVSQTNEQKCSIYISIPFCPSRCTYCSFISYASKKLFDLIPSYVIRLVEDIRGTFGLIKELGLTLSCIYIGGGTPTMLNESQLEIVLKTIYECVDVTTLDEFTLEGGRPDTITEEKLNIAKKYGVGRISVNPQTLNDTVLEKIGRRHTVAEFLEAFNKVKASKITAVNTDLIAGLEGDNFESFKGTVDRILELEPENVTIHTFCVKKSAQALHDDEQIYNKEDEDAIKSVNYALKTLTANGYVPYYMYRQKNTVGNLENIGYAKKGYMGLYNVFMMSDAHTVFGIGSGATTKLVKTINSKTEILRIFSPKYPYEYLRDNQKSFDKIKEFFDRR